MSSGDGVNITRSLLLALACMAGGMNRLQAAQSLGCTESAYAERIKAAGAIYRKRGHVIRERVDIVRAAEREGILA